MPFAYYDRLSRREKALYDRSDRVGEIRLPQPEALRPLVPLLRTALERDDRRAIEVAARMLSRGVTEMLAVEPTEVAVLAVRPLLQEAELHGLYTREDGRPPRIRLWMRTARLGRVVAFRTFLRTLLHEVGHHLDYTYLELEESFHTEGFFRRESSLFYQLVPKDPAALRRPPPEPTRMP
jgi:hypothetical protein